ncbi:MAG: hypothetical protein ACJA1A_001479 [Saprospiraceae bacterium]|jgi:hypothetical protein
MISINRGENMYHLILMEKGIWILSFFQEVRCFYRNYITFFDISFLHIVTIVLNPQFLDHSRTENHIFAFLF